MIVHAYAFASQLLPPSPPDELILESFPTSKATPTLLSISIPHLAMPESTPAFNLTALDRQLLAMTDEEFVPHDWNELRDIIGA